MIDAFKKANGGLFTSVEKADVGGSYQQLEKQGIALMGWADPYMPDSSMPKHVEEALVDAIRNPMAAHYTAPIGNQELKNEISKKLREYNGLDVDPERNILITPGSDSGLYYSILPFIEKGTEVLIPSPSYPNNYLNIEIMGGVVVPVPLKEHNNYQIEIEEFESRLSDKTKMVILTHPNNPTTTVYNRESLEQLCKFIVKHDLILVCDQAFEDFCYGKEFLTPAAMPGMFERTITVFSFSKGMGLSGLRVGYVVCSDTIMDTLYANAVSVLGATNTASQLAIIAACQDNRFMEDFRVSFDYRRQAAFEIFNSIPNVSTSMPESGFLCWVNVSKIGNSSEIVDYLLKEARVSVNDGINYGLGGEGHFRIVLGVYKDNQKVVDALNRIKKALIKWQEDK